MSAPPPLNLPIGQHNRPLPPKVGSGGQDSHLTSPSPAKTTTIHLSAGDRNTSTYNHHHHQSSTPSRATPQQNQKLTPTTHSPQNQSRSGIDNAFGAYYDENNDKNNNVQNASSSASRTRNTAQPNVAASSPFSSPSHVVAASSNRPPAREERPINQYFQLKHERENDPNIEVKDQLRAKLHTFFYHYSPHLFHEVDGLVTRYWNHQDNLWSKLHKKYGPDPDKLIKGMDTRTRLTRFFNKYEPSLIPDIDKVIKSYGGYEDTMWKALTGKYGPEISPDDADGPGGKYKQPMDLLSRLKRYFKEHDMAKLAKASEMSKTYEKREADLRSMLKLIYGAELEIDPEAAEREAREDKERQEAAKKENEYQEKETKKWLVAFLQQHNPKRMSEVDSLLAHFKGRQEALKDTVVALFGTGSIDYNTPRLRLIRIYQKYNPLKLEEVDTLLDKFKDRTGDLFLMLKDKYGYEKEPEYKPDEYAARWIEQQENKMPAKMTEKTKKRLQLFFLTYDPKLASSVEHVMILYRGKEDEMWKTLIERYGPEPEFVDIEEEKRKKEEAQKAERERLEQERIVKERADARFRVRVSRMYRRYNPKKVSEVDTVIAKYAGRQDELMEMLVNKYGEEEYFTEAELDQEIDGPRIHPVMRERIVRMYHKYNPSKLGELEEVILPKYIGKEEELIAGLCAKYGPEPAWGEGNSIRDRVTRFYVTYKPTKLDQMELVMEKYVGKEDELIQMLTDKYGPEPEFTDTSSNQSAYDPSANAAAVADQTASRSILMSNGGDSNNKAQHQQEQQERDRKATEEIKTRLHRFYLKYAPEKANEEQMSKVLTKYQAREDELFEMLVAKFGPEPHPDEKLQPGNTKPPTSSSSSALLSTREQVTRYYKKNDPSKLDNVDKILNKYSGRDQDLIEMMRMKYGEVPTDAEIAAIDSDQKSTKGQQQQQQQNNVSSSSTTATTGVVISKRLTYDSSSRDKLTAVYQKFDPTKLSNVDMILEKYSGREDTLWGMLMAKYETLDPEEFGIRVSAAPPPPPVSSSSLSSTSSPPSNLRDKLTAVYKKHDPSKIENVDMIIAKYKDNLQVLFNTLTVKYGDLGEFGISAVDDDNNNNDSSTFTGNQPIGNSTADRLMRYYLMYEPAKANDEQVSKIVAKYQGKEDDLFEMLRIKYGAEPEIPSSPSQKPKVKFSQN